MTPDQARFLVIALLTGHGIAHGGAIGALWWIATHDGPTGGWAAARIWAMPTLAAATATNVAIAFWLVSMLGFIAAGLSLALLPTEAWRLLAIGSAAISLVGIVLFAGTWPPFNMLAALAANIVVLGALLVAHWPPQALLAK